MSSYQIAIKPTSTPLSDAERAARMEKLVFGREFTEHMVRAQWTRGMGWHDAELVPHAPLELDPAAMVFHYGQAIFEGLKVYGQPDGGVALFRPDANARRFASSARRLAMPEVPEDLFFASLAALVRQDRGWVPQKREQSLYLRPYMIATEGALGVRPADEYLYLLIASPTGSYFPRGVAPVTVWLSTEYTRAAPGGTGSAKAAGNYAASLVAQMQAAEKGCDHVVWLDAVEHRWVEEVGVMNLYFVYGQGSDARLVTPRLTGTLLPGVTRDSMLTLARDLGYPAEEGMVSVEEWQEGNATGEITEVFACGTAAVVTPIGAVKSNRADWTIAGCEAGPITMQLRNAMLYLQHGSAPDPYGWRHPLP